MTEDFFSTDIQPVEQQQDSPVNINNDNEIYKRWIQTKQGGRFCTLSLWPEAFKLVVDIGQTDTGGKLSANVKLYCDMAEIYTYLEAVKLGTAKDLYPSTTQNDKTYFDNYISYGGGKSKDNKPISRILKIQAESADRDKYLWKGGVFAAKPSGTGGFIPDYNQKHAEASILFPRVVMANVCNLLLMKHMAK